MNSRNSAAEEQDLLCAVALNAMIPLANERTLQSAYYILRGRKANQTLQDVHLYTLYPYYRMFSRFPREDWEKIVSTLFQEGWIVPVDAAGMNSKPTFTVSDTGLQYAQQTYQKYRFDVWFAPFTQSDLSERIEPFWSRLHLMVQTISQMLQGDLGFIPVVSDKAAQRFVKTQLSEASMRIAWKEQLADELFRLWEPLEEDVQELLFSQLSGVGQVGKTMGQLADARQTSRSYLMLQFRFGLAASIQVLLEQSDQFPLLANLVTQSHKLDPRLTESAARTYALLQIGCEKKEIAAKRQMKESTIEDHLVEIALRCPEWDDSSYLPKELAKVIIETSERLGTSRLRLIKDQLGAEVTYLQIRLALARATRGAE
ncbi:helix-turn-helix domain-containing protein [Brevibacillus sp. 179-C 1.1 NHS]|uniref:helix-turn-helix domain-containing protein n=1 Tax=Brevibacillus sp. 179-C 1.1 NHS TaxID=3235177 RepID=UPI0039A04B7B